MNIDPGKLFHIRMPGAYAATYYHTGGESVETVVFVNHDAEVFPGGFESSVVDKEIQITLRYDHILQTAKGDRIVTHHPTNGDEVFVVDGEELLNNRFKIKVPVKNA